MASSHTGSVIDQGAQFRFWQGSPLANWLSGRRGSLAEMIELELRLLRKMVASDSGCFLISGFWRVLLCDVTLFALNLADIHLHLMPPAPWVLVCSLMTLRPPAPDLPA